MIINLIRAIRGACRYICKCFLYACSILIIALVGVVSFVKWSPYAANIIDKLPMWERKELYGQAIAAIEPASLGDLAYNLHLNRDAEMPSVAGQHAVKRGIRLMRNSSVAIMGLLGPGSECSLRRTFPQVEAIAAAFNSSYIVLLTTYPPDFFARNYNSSRVFRENALIVVEDIPCPRIDGRKCLRPERIAHVRNRGLAAIDLLEASRRVSIGYLIWADMDVFGIDIRGIADSFGRPRWNAVCANGITAHGTYFDTFAFRSYNDSNTPTGLQVQRLHSAAMQSESPLIPVQSCFGGLAIYRRSAIGPCRYDITRSAAHECEHVSFNECVHKVYSNARMKVWYGPEHTFRDEANLFDPSWCAPPRLGSL